MSNRRRGFVAILVGAGLLVSAPVALAHIERASYWPNPGAEKAGKAKAGGKVPKTRSLFTALDKEPLGKTRVVCQGKSSLRKALKDIKECAEERLQASPLAEAQADRREEGRAPAELNRDSS